MTAPTITLPFSLALAEFPAKHFLYQDGEQRVNWAAFCERVRHWDAICGAITESKVAVFHPNSGEFLTLVIAAWRAGKTIILPPNTLQATLQRLRQDTSVFLGDFGDQSYEVTQEQSYSPHVASIAPHADKEALVLYTSGSTGEPALIGKTFKQLNAEIGLLEQLWGHTVKRSLFIATVPHHHMYGLTFKLLWPLLTGKPFLVTDVPYLERLPELAQQHELALISSPAHLINIPTSVDWVALRGRVNAVFTAGAPLPGVAASQSAASFYCEPTEIFGSTETGVVAWRHQQIDAVWQVFDGIHCQCNDDRQLLLRSPALPDDDWFVGSDKIQLRGDNRFELCGRTDKVVKVAGKRVSLTEVEHLLSTHQWVREVKVLPHFDRPSRLCAIVSLNSQGNAHLVDQGVRLTGKKLCAALAGGVERVAYPRYWRFVPHLPVNQQGKTTVQELTGLFQSHEHITQPTIISSDFNAERHEYRAELVVAENLFYLEGHFPGQPILPGVVQIAWVVEKGRDLFAALGEFEKMEAVKFQQIIKPGERFSLTLRLDSANNTLAFNYEANHRKVSSGRIVFRPGHVDAV